MRWLIYLLSLPLLQACSSQSVISDADRSPTPQDAVSGTPVLESTPLQWGGVIIKTVNLAETTEIQILAYPLKDNGRPDTQALSSGRFIARQSGYLEAADYAVGREVTATGRLSEIRPGRVNQADYKFPVLLCDEVVLWDKSSERRLRPRVRFGFGASSGGGSYSGVGIGVSFH
ncbi:MAG: Slp family lipoprotein [Candidatus Thiodiazotropha sp. (ex Dulcina madagascariensis)]|nr:Slp family lipoprotein [Candidatus Thiodiazotropha sp. (ex Dulcina madagascariensis)]